MSSRPDPTSSGLTPLSQALLAHHEAQLARAGPPFLMNILRGTRPGHVHTGQWTGHECKLALGTLTLPSSPHPLGTFPC